MLDSLGSFFGGGGAAPFSGLEDVSGSPSFSSGATARSGVNGSDAFYFGAFNAGSYESTADKAIKYGLLATAVLGGIWLWKKK